MTPSITVTLPLIKTMDLFIDGITKAVNERTEDAETDYQRGILEGLRMALTVMRSVRDKASDAEAGPASL